MVLVAGASVPEAVVIALVETPDGADASAADAADAAEVATDAAEVATGAAEAAACDDACWPGDEVTPPPRSSERMDWACPGVAANSAAADTATTAAMLRFIVESRVWILGWVNGCVVRSIVQSGWVEKMEQESKGRTGWIERWCSRDETRIGGDGTMVDGVQARMDGRSFLAGERWWPSIERG